MDSGPAAPAQPGALLPGVSGPGIPEPGTQLPGCPFRGPGTAARAAPFAVVAVLAEGSLALPPGSSSTPATIASIVLLAATAAAFALPWGRLPSWATVIVPLSYAGSVLALTIAAGTTSGVAIVALMPVVWTALFHGRWESACVVVATLLAVLVFSLVPVAGPAAVLVRRLVFWGALACLISVATHGLRGRIRRSQVESARLQDRLREMSLLRDRDRIATDLQDQVIQRIFAASLSLQTALAMTGDTEIGHRIEGATWELDNATRLVRQSIFGLRGRPGHIDLRRGILDLCGEFSRGLGVTPDVSFSGAVDGAMPQPTARLLLRVLRETLHAVGQQSGQVQVAVAAGENARLTVTVPGRWPPAGQAGRQGAAENLRASARQIGAAVEIGPDSAGGTRLAWQLPMKTPPDS